MKKLVIIGTALVALGGPLAQSAGAMPADVTPVVQQQSPVRAMTPAEQRALILRSEGLNQKYHLGAYKTGMTPAEYRALQLRSEALNQRYGLGTAGLQTLERGTNERFAADNPTRGDLVDSTPTVTSSPDFQWSDAGIGAGVLLGIVALIGAGFFEVRHHGRLGTS